MEVNGNLSYISEDIDSLWNHRVYDNEEVRRLVRERYAKDGRIYFTGHNGRPTEVLIIGCANDWGDNQRKMFYLKEKGKNWICRRMPLEFIDKVEVL